MFIQVSSNTKSSKLNDIHEPLKEREETLEKSVESSSHIVLIFCKAIVADDE